MPLDLQPFIERVEALVASHRLAEPGQYRRWNWQSADGERDVGLNPYGCADAANILYTIGRFPRDTKQRAQWIETLQSLQNPQSGLFYEATHHDIHCTAHCIAALELFDAAPLYPLTALRPLLEAGALEAFLDDLDWRDNPWRASHQGAGCYAALTVAGEASTEWKERYFAWLWREADERSGFWRRNCVNPVQHGATLSLFPHLAGSFHYLFNHEAERRPLPFAAAMVDSCLRLIEDGSFPLGNAVGFAEVDWVYCLTRSLRQCGHRFEESQTALRTFAARYASYLLALDPQSDEGLNDLHRLFGALCAIAELQQALPGLVRTSHPLKLVLDRRPFI